jgi:hypothetical protein
MKQFSKTNSSKVKKKKQIEKLQKKIIEQDEVENFFLYFVMDKFVVY